MEINSKNIPRDLTEREKDWLHFLLPEERPGYLEYKKKIEKLQIVGKGRFDGGNVYLGKAGAKPDTNIPSAPVFAAGTILYEEAEVYITIHEEEDDLIEIDISNVAGESIPEKLTEIKRWTYSHWSPGQKASPDNSEVREVHLIKNRIVLAVAPNVKRIWIFDAGSEVNHFIPVSKFHNELMKIKGIRDPETALNPNLIFKDDNRFSDEEIGQAFLLYNKYWKKIDIDYSLFEKEETSKKSFLSRLFSKRS